MRDGRYNDIHYQISIPSWTPARSRVVSPGAVVPPPPVHLPFSVPSRLVVLPPVHPPSHGRGPGAVVSPPFSRSVSSVRRTRTVIVSRARRSRARMGPPSPAVIFVVARLAPAVPLPLRPPLLLLEPLLLLLLRLAAAALLPVRVQGSVHVRGFHGHGDGVRARPRAVARGRFGPGREAAAHGSASSMGRKTKLRTVPPPALPPPPL